MRGRRGRAICTPARRAVRRRRGPGRRHAIAGGGYAAGRRNQPPVGGRHGAGPLRGLSSGSGVPHLFPVIGPSGDAKLPPGFSSLAEELKGSFRAWEECPAPWPEERLERLARRAFELQFSANPPYRRYCRRLGVTPDSVTGWREIPPVPTAAFREVSLCLGGRRAAEVVFRTSGTTRGAERRGSHPVVDTGLYAASLEAAFRWHVLGGRTGMAIGSLIPPFEPAEESSLSWMAEAVLRRFGTPGSGFLAGPGGVDWEEATRFLERASADGRPVCLLATTLGADEWMRLLEGCGARFHLPPGSRMMDTGGAKGRRGLERRDVVVAVVDRLGIAEDLVINELGMTELLSQRYSRPPGADGAAMGSSTAAATSRPGAVTPRAEAANSRVEAATPHAGATTPRPGAATSLFSPPWLLTRALDPNTLEELPEDDVGALCHFDLANAGSVCAVLTEDLGRVRGNVVEWVGRSPGAPPRGCSLATAELLAAQEDGP